MPTFAETLNTEITRVRALLDACAAGHAPDFRAYALRNALDRAETAAAGTDGLAIVRAVEELRLCQ